MRNSFDTHVNDIDIIRYFTTNQNNSNIKLVDGNNKLDLLTFFNINMDISDYDNNLRNFKSAIQSGNGFTAQNTNNINLKSDVISIFDKVSKLYDNNHKLHFIVYYTGFRSNNNSGPSLQGLQSKELEDKFLKLYEMSMVYYLENFDTYYDENKKRLVYKTKPMDTIKNSNALRNLIKAYNLNENNEIEYFDNSNIHYSSDSYLDDKSKSFILDVNSSELEKIDINNNEEISKVMSKYWEESDENSNNEDKNKNNEIYKI
ncbi:hypothetical protein LY90DRAFT_677409 [Neocallimastix californiae]|uniref:Uncharacterized protein n=1 Tax=Neocallimastix californiae TaxID=1754190 RepID=A0A1Y2A2X4_9FUNG|nr:hypothetical protein LY90DRAFT_677409 [Neocallimastix californiae]|eukprot:ORY16657.1 hypothetical protein LY90DRAFT_677409 [Neocallimastix californiae]